MAAKPVIDTVKDVDAEGTANEVTVGAVVSATARVVAVAAADCAELFPAVSYAETVNE
jgi:hypothetical protein